MEDGRLASLAGGDARLHFLASIEACCYFSPSTTQRSERTR
jgi:hypothetical protein